MSAFIPLKRNCPVCSGVRRDCRQSKATNLIHCRHSEANPIDYVFRGLDRQGFGMWAEKVEIEAHSEQQREEWRRQRELEKQQRLEAEHQQRAQLLSELERDREIRKVFDQLNLNQEHRADLYRRGLTDDSIKAGGFKSIQQWQKLDSEVSHRLAGVSINGRSLITQAGYIWPVKNPKGEILGWQIRKDDDEIGRFAWPSSATKKRPNGATVHLRNGELPIACHRPATGQVLTDAIELTEGTGVKPFITAQRLNRITLGAAGGNFASSPETFKSYLDELSAELGGTKSVILSPDAGAVANPNVMRAYRETHELTSSWGYQLKFRWWNQLDKAQPDIDELTGEEAIAYISAEEFLALGQQSSYTPSRQSIDTVTRDEWELKFGFGQWLSKNIRSILGKAKGFAKEPTSAIQKPVPLSIVRYPEDALPVPADYEGRELPRIIFKKGKRLEILIKLRELGWKNVCDRSFTGSGKSHEAGLLHPDAESDNKIWYFDLNHTNPSTETVEAKTNMPPRHNGMVAVEGKFTPKGQPHLKWATGKDDIPIVPSICHNAELFTKLRSKGWNVDAEHEVIETKDKKKLSRNPICKGCRFSHKCHEEIGEGYGYLAIRRDAMEARSIRASLESAPNPHGEKSYDYSSDTAIVEEASRYLRGTQSLSAWGNEVAQLWGYVERKAPEAFDALQPIRFALQDALEGKFDHIEKGFNRGADHEILIENLPDASAIANLPNLIFQVEQAMPTIKDVVEEPDSVTGLGGQWRSTGQFARDVFKAQAAYQTRENIEALPPNILVNALKIWAGLKSGSLRVHAKQLQVTAPFSRHAAILEACNFVVLLDATPNTQYLEKILGNSILEIEEERPPLSNVTVVNVNMKGMGSNQISDTCKSRQLALLEWIQGQHQEVKVLANKADSHLPLNGWWFNDNRGSNAFKGVEALAAFNVPRPNLGIIQDEYRTLFGSLENFEQYYQQLIQSEIIQLIGRPRAHQYPEKQFSIYLISTNQDLSFLTDLGCRTVDKEAFELTPLAGTAEQITRWKILQAVGQLQDQKEKLTQEAIATLTGKSQALISKVAKHFGGWARLKKLLLALLGFYRASNNFETFTEQEQDFINGYLSPVIDSTVEAIATAETQSDVQSEMDGLMAALTHCASQLGWKKFLQALASIPNSSQVNLLSVVMQAVPIKDCLNGQQKQRFR